MKIPEMLCEIDQESSEYTKKVVKRWSRKVVNIVSEETDKEENRFQLELTATRGGLGTIHRNQVQQARFPAQYPRDQKLLMQWDETSKSSPLNLISMNKTKFIELGLYTQKPSSMNLISMYTNRVQ